MPIRINLLAEAQAAEDLRRRDPAKRALLLGALLVVLMLVWSSFLELRAMLADSALNTLQAQVQTRTNEFQRVIANQNKINQAQSQFVALQRLTDCRFLNGNLLDALQHTTVPGVALTLLRVEQNYFKVAATPPKTNGTRVLPGTPATITEHIVLVLHARDSSAHPGDAVNAFKSVIAANPYFKAMLQPTNGIRLTDLSAPQQGPDGKPFVLFTMECHFPDQTR